MTSDRSLPWVGHWRDRRLVVFDPKHQPESQDFMLLYFVQGHSLCARNRAVEREHVATCKFPEDHDFALEQYHRWVTLHGQELEAKKSQVQFAVEEPAAPRRKCPICGGEGNVTYRVGTFSDGAHSDGQNITDHCDNCHGRGYVDDVLEF